MRSETKGAREVLTPDSSSLSPLSIGIDASRSLRIEPTGTEFYSRQITGHMLAEPNDRFAFRLYAPETPTAEAMRGAAPPPHDQRAVTVRTLPGNRLWTHRALAWELCRRPPDVLFVPAHVVPFLPPACLPATVVTLHDIGYRYFPRSHTALQRLYLELSTRWSAAAAQRIIAVSRHTADDLQRVYGVPDAKIRVIHEAPVQRAPAPGQDAGPTPVYERPFALYVGTIQPRKNLLRLIDAFARLIQQQQIGWDLVLVGRWGWLSEEYEKHVAASGLTGRVHFPGYLPDAAVAALMQQALFFTFPSLFEGFGLPVLEAQTTGVAVMCAKNSALPEIAGDAALLVDPEDVDDIAAAMLRLSRDEALRQELIAKGYENVKRFSWEKAARETLAVLEEAAAKK
ncbi:MAG: glycosyltransferase family 4 protein [Caldilineaceae bacterium SB0670_bin_27]|uniref:Glycosyltransferase family 4 protein n=1 Tax=Caldilineaceae bacterium SB0664_bin_27 TaxID=2605260 RepID=A0A6B0YWN5_9CHLR|nr:glycosyltransferase family 4 protein [Caldilineaceae bacterium SB0664_bin_27]MYJ77955.1 glycosyltransferase family 4 protein [Caldilineaceae bacterium SB0670_bin_27]